MPAREGGSHGSSKGFGAGSSRGFGSPAGSSKGFASTAGSSKGFGSSGRRPQKSRSLPALERSPLEAPQVLCSVHVGRRSVERSTVKGGSTKLVSQGRLQFSTFERGLECERSHVVAKVPPQKLPPLQDVMRLAMQEFNLRIPPRKNKSSAQRSKSEALTLSPYKGGPRLPVRRPPEEDLFAGQPALGSALSQDLFGAPMEDSPVDQPPEVPRQTPRDVDEKSAEQERPPEPQPVVKPVDQFSVEDLPFPWKVDEVHSAFTSFDTDRDGELHVEELPSLLKYLGARAQPGDVEQIVREQTRFATLSFEEVMDFLHTFRHLDACRMRDTFLAADSDGSGELDFRELFLLLQASGYYPTAQSALEAFEHLDKDKSSTITIMEYEPLREYLRVTEGFTKADYAEIEMLFAKSCLGKASPEEVFAETWRITMYLGYCASQQAVKEFCLEVNPDPRSGISRSELLKIVRMVRETEIESMKRIMTEYGDDPKVLPCEDLGLALTDLGYFVSEDAVNEILEQLGETETDEYVTLEEFGAFLRAYRRVEGFTEEEVRELQEAFDQEGRMEPGTLHTLEVGKVLRWFGFARTVQEVTRLVEDIDLDGSGVLEFGEFTKLMRRLTQQEAEQRQKIFQRLATPSSLGVLEVHISKMLDAVVLLAGAQPENSILETTTKALQDELLGPEAEGKEKGNSALAFIGRQAFEAWFRHFKRLLIQDIRASAGYSIGEKAWLQKMFNAYDSDGSGSIERRELMQLIAALFPDSMKSKEEQRNVQKALEQVVEGGKGQLDFKRFLLLSRKCDDARDSRDMQLEAEVVKECGYTHEEVDGFRQIFSANVDWKGELSIDALHSILNRVVDLSEDDTENMRRLVCDVHPQGREVARFPQFLRLIKRLTDENYGHLNDQAERFLKRQQQQQHMLQTARRVVSGE